MRLGKINVKIGLALMLSKFSFELSGSSMNSQELQFHPSKADLFTSKELKFKLKLRSDKKLFNEAGSLFLNKNVH